jgi:cyclopropane-fatty-acyl-phospholipid synthase
MDVHTGYPRSPRGRHLLKADRGFATGPAWRSRLSAPGFHRVLDRIDAGLEHGSLEAELPDGTRRLLGGRAPGPAVMVDLRRWRALVRLMTTGSVGWYRAWAEGEWSSPDPVALFDLFVRNRLTLGRAARAKGFGRLVNRIAHALRGNSKRRARRNIAFHYDLGNDFYAAWLDRGMAYSSALFAEPIETAGVRESLEVAQARKVKALLARLDLKPGQRLLEIGCGWGGLAEVAARDFGAEVVGITLSESQKAYADARMTAAGLAHCVSIELTDYRDVAGEFDAVASIEMVEAVGAEYWPAYMDTIARVLKPGGRAGIQYIAIDDAIFDHYAASADFIQTYVFPGGMLISESRFRAAAEAVGLAWGERRGFGLHYAETLRRWRDAFDMAVAEERLPAGFDAAFARLWRYYLMYCEGGFRGGGIEVAQVTLVKG